MSFILLYSFIIPSCFMLPQQWKQNLDGKYLHLRSNILIHCDRHITSVSKNNTENLGFLVDSFCSFGSLSLPFHLFHHSSQNSVPLSPERINHPHCLCLPLIQPARFFLCKLPDASSVVQSSTKQGTEFVHHSTSHYAHVYAQCIAVTQ